MKEITCTICGNTFYSESGNAKFCSDECRLEGSKIARRAWEERTGYKDKQRELMREKRKKERIDNIKQNKIDLTERKKERSESESKRIEQLQNAAAAGDPLSRMMLAKRYSKEFWDAYRDYEIQNMKCQKKIKDVTVNDISVYDDDFVTRVVASIEEHKIILIETIFK